MTSYEFIWNIGCKPYRPHGPFFFNEKIFVKILPILIEAWFQNGIPTFYKKIPFISHNSVFFLTIPAVLNKQYYFFQISLQFSSMQLNSLVLLKLLKILYTLYILFTIHHFLATLAIRRNSELWDIISKSEKKVWTQLRGKKKLKLWESCSHFFFIFCSRK